MFDAVATLGLEPHAAQTLQQMLQQFAPDLDLPVLPLTVGASLPAIVREGKSVLVWCRPGQQAEIADLKLTRWLLTLFGTKCPWFCALDPPDPQLQALCKAAAAVGIFRDDAGSLETIRNAVLHLRMLAPALPQRMTIAKILRLVHLWKGNVRLKVSVEPDRRGYITVVDGQLVRVETRDGMGGLEALKEIHTWPDGAIAVVPAEDPTPNIDVTTRELLMPDCWDSTIVGKSAPIAEPPQPVTVDQACAGVLETIQGALACWVVDLNSGLLTGSQYMNSYFSQDFVDTVASTAMRAFRGRAIRKIQEMLTFTRTQSEVDRALFATPAVYQFMQPVADRSAVVVLVTRKSTTPETGWQSLEKALPQICGALV